MLHAKLRRGLAFCLTLCMVLSLLPANVIALDYNIGDSVTTDTEEAPPAVEKAVWVLTDKVECKKIVHAHEEKCYYKSCDHKEGHLSTCYGESTDYALCEHADETQHTGSVTLADVVTIDGTNVSWKTDHPAYPVVYAVYKAAYDAAYDSAKFMREMAAKAAGVAALVGKTFCYTTSSSATPDKCTHGECTDYSGACYTKLCILEEHAHEATCFQYTWTLKADLNQNGVADDVDTYYTIEYVNDGKTIYKEKVLVGMPTPTVEAPSKDADAQYTYTFIGWDMPVSETVTGDAKYTAVYSNTINKYTVTWLDEDGTELEIDKDVEYGAMPSYDAALPEKKGDNTVSYTFAGWAPTVEAVTGNVTYTATYTTHQVFEVKFMIDGELQKTEYVIDGEKVAAFAPTREHYTLSAWMNDAEVYDFDDAVTGNMVLNASWKLVESVITMQAPNATCPTGTGVYTVGTNILFAITPQEGYFVKTVTINGETIALTYDDGVARFEMTPEKAEYLIQVTTEKAALELDIAEMNVYDEMTAENIFKAVYKSSNPALHYADVKVEYLAYTIELLGKTYEWWVAPGTDVSLESFLNQFGLGALASYIPAESLPHAFGAEGTEKVRVSYAGTEKYPALSADTTVVLKDMRTETMVNLNTGIVVTYGATAEDILQLVFKNVATANGVVTDAYTDVEISMDSLNAGERKATVTFKGNQFYAPSAAQVKVTIQKAHGKVNVSASTVKYGTTINVSELIQSNANCIQIAGGLKLGANASADMGPVVYVNLPQLIDMDSIQNEMIRDLLEDLLKEAEETMSGTLTLDEVRDALNEALPYLETAEDFGYTTNLTTEAATTLLNVLDNMSQLEELRGLQIKMSIGKDIILKDAGLYLVAAIASDANYTTTYGGNVAVITPDGFRATLDWTVKDANGIITVDALRNGYDLSARVVAVHEGSIAEAQARMKIYFIGTNKNGEFIITQDQKDLDIGGYAEIAFLMDLGNTMYYAEPIVRTFIVAADAANVQFVDANGNPNNDRIFEYGQDATMQAVATDRTTGERLNGTMKYYYAGLQANGELYHSANAPTRPGAYTVVALFVGENESHVGTAIGALVIKPITVNAEAEDKTVEFDGKPHSITFKDATGMHCIYVVLDEANNMNVIIPEAMYNQLAAAGLTVTEALKQLEDLDKLLEKMPEEMKSYGKELLSELKLAINELRKEYDINDITINAELPSAVGTYRFYVFGIKDTEHEIAMASATLTITPADKPEPPTEPEEPEKPECKHEYDNACDATCNKCGAIREVGKHNYVGTQTKEPGCGTAGEMKYTCSECGHSYTEAIKATGEHTYDNACDATCNLCGATREVGDHVYDDEYDPDCNICGATREVPEKPDDPEPPQTGDKSRIGTFLFMMVISAAALVFLMTNRKGMTYNGKYSK